MTLGDSLRVSGVCSCRMVSEGGVKEGTTMSKAIILLIVVAAVIVFGYFVTKQED